MNFWVSGRIGESCNCLYSKIGRCGNANERIQVMRLFRFNVWFRLKTIWLEQVWLPPSFKGTSLSTIKIFIPCSTLFLGFSPHCYPFLFWWVVPFIKGVCRGFFCSVGQLPVPHNQLALSTTIRWFVNFYFRVFDFACLKIR